MKQLHRQLWHSCKFPFIKAAKIIKPRNTFEWVLLAIAVPVPLGVVLWVFIKTCMSSSPLNPKPEMVEIIELNSYKVVCEAPQLVNTQAFNDGFLLLPIMSNAL